MKAVVQRFAGLIFVALVVGSCSRCGTGTEVSPRNEGSFCDEHLLYAEKIIAERPCIEKFVAMARFEREHGEYSETPPSQAEMDKIEGVIGGTGDNVCRFILLSRYALLLWEKNEHARLLQTLKKTEDKDSAVVVFYDLFSAKKRDLSPADLKALRELAAKLEIANEAPLPPQCPISKLNDAIPIAKALMGDYSGAWAVAKRGSRSGQLKAKICELAEVGVELDKAPFCAEEGGAEEGDFQGLLLYSRLQEVMLNDGIDVREELKKLKAEFEARGDAETAEWIAGVLRNPGENCGLDRICKLGPLAGSSMAYATNTMAQKSDYLEYLSSPGRKMRLKYIYENHLHETMKLENLASEIASARKECKAGQR